MEFGIKGFRVFLFEFVTWIHPPGAGERPQVGRAPQRRGGFGCAFGDPGPQNFRKSLCLAASPGRIRRFLAMDYARCGEGELEEKRTPAERQPSAAYEPTRTSPEQSAERQGT